MISFRFLGILKIPHGPPLLCGSTKCQGTLGLNSLIEYRVERLSGLPRDTIWWSWDYNTHLLTAGLSVIPVCQNLDSVDQDHFLRHYSKLLSKSCCFQHYLSLYQFFHSCNFKKIDSPAVSLHNSINQLLYSSQKLFKYVFAVILSYVRRLSCTVRSASLLFFKNVTTWSNQVLFF